MCVLSCIICNSALLSKYTKSYRLVHSLFVVVRCQAVAFSIYSFFVHLLVRYLFVHFVIPVVPADKQTYILRKYFGTTISLV